MLVQVQAIPREDSIIPANKQSQSYKTQRFLACEAEAINNGRNRTSDAGLGTGGDPEEASQRRRQEGRESRQRCPSHGRRDRDCQEVYSPFSFFPHFFSLFFSKKSLEGRMRIEKYFLFSDGLTSC